ncbi:glycerol-3-phosphate phosphatase-like [Glandiceps talaboti]
MEECTGLGEMTKAGCMELTSELMPHFIASIDTVLCDCEGVIWKGSSSKHPVPGATEALEKLRKRGKKIFFLTNTNTKSRKQILQELNKLGFQANEEEIVCTSFAAAAYLKHSVKFEGKVYLVGSVGLAEELELAGIQYIGLGPDIVDSGSTIDDWADLPIDPEVKAVVVGFDEHLSYHKLVKAATYLSNPGCLFIATNEDTRFPFDTKVVLPATGLCVQAVKTASQRDPIVLGKPHRYLFASITNSVEGIDPSRTVMIGDTLATDILLGKNCGLKTLLVETGLSNREDARQNQQSTSKERQMMVPDYFIKSIGDLGNGVKF